MKKNKLTVLLSIALSIVLLASLTLSPVAVSGAVTYSSKTGKYTATKISHPEKGTCTTDGIVDYTGNGTVSASDEGQGDRGQSYAWSAISYGDYVYVATCYNSMGSTLSFMDTVLGHDYDKKQMEATLNVMFNGTFYTGQEDGVDSGGILVKVNVNTCEVELLMGKSVDGNGVLLRNVCEYENMLYFCGSVNGLPKIVQVNPETDECTVVYQGISAADYYQAYLEGICTGIRGLCEYDGRLIVSCVTMNGPQILISDHPWDGQDAFTEIADGEALYNYPAYHFADSIYGGSIWEMVEFGDSLYVSLCTGTPDNKPDENTMQSFAIVRGDENADGTWTWTPLIGDLQDGAKYTFGIDPERTRAGAGVMYVFNDYLYIGEYNDEEIPIEEILFNMNFDFMNANLEQSVNLYRMDAEENIELVVGDATQMFPEGGLSGIGSGFGRNENQYIWRMTEYGGKLYVGTFDTSSLLEVFGQFVNGDLASMSFEEWQRLIGYIRMLVEISAANSSDGELTEDATNAERIAYLLNTYTAEELWGVLTSFDPAILGDVNVRALLDTVNGVIECGGYLSTATRGFDLYVSSDGVNFETITIDGFGDPYNHGLRVFAPNDNGLVIGTANPFYACQLWVLEDDETIAEDNNTVNELVEQTIVTFILEKMSWLFKFFDIITGMFTF